MNRILSSDGNNILGYSQTVIMTRALIHTTLWWPCLWLNEWISGLGIHGLVATVAKLIFYVNNFWMALFWYFIHSIAKGTEPTPKDVVKYLAFWLAIHIIMEIPLILSSI